jgi:hypothetical protein
MAITYTWEVTGLKVQNIDAELQNAVVQTYWKKTGTDEHGNEGTFHGATPFTVNPNDESGPFIPFEDLTEQDVLDWIQSVVIGGYEEHVNAQIQKQIDDKISPITEPALPWAPDKQNSAGGPNPTV